MANIPICAALDSANLVVGGLVLSELLVVLTVDVTRWLTVVDEGVGIGHMLTVVWLYTSCVCILVVVTNSVVLTVWFTVTVAVTVGKTPVRFSRQPV